MCLTEENADSFPIESIIHSMLFYIPVSFLELSERKSSLLKDVYMVSRLEILIPVTAA